MTDDVPDILHEADVRAVIEDEIAQAGSGTSVALSWARFDYATGALADGADVYPDLTLFAGGGTDITLDPDNQTVHLTAGAYLITTEVSLGTVSGGTFTLYYDDGNSAPYFAALAAAGYSPHTSTVVRFYDSDPTLQLNVEIDGGTGTGGSGHLRIVRLGDLAASA